jgi:catechol 2,3-dioxygenase-like lactoylglutathione lyase family enzyme
MAETEVATGITQVGPVIISVTDQDRALEFYVDKLGFEKRVDVAFGDGDRWIEVAPPGAKTTIALAVPPEGSGSGIDVALTTRDADADHAALLDRDVETDPEVLRLGDPVPPMFTFRDPDGNSIRIVERED